MHAAGGKVYLEPLVSGKSRIAFFLLGPAHPMKFVISSERWLRSSRNL